MDGDCNTAEIESESEREFSSQLVLWGEISNYAANQAVRLLTGKNRALECLDTAKKSRVPCEGSELFVNRAKSNDQAY